MSRSTARMATFSCVFAFSLFVYYLTLTQEVNFEDSAELTLQAYRLGVTHPPGSPLHSLLGRAIMTVVPDPAIAMNWLSAVATSIAAGILSVMLLDATGILFVALFVPLVFAFSPRLWSLAVTTEVYNVNAMFLAAALYCVQIWNRDLSWRSMIGAATCYGLSLGVYLPNALLLPAFVFLLLRPHAQRYRQLAAATGIVLVLALAATSYSVVRAHSQPPLGAVYIPTSIADGVKFFSGSQFQPPASLTANFYWLRSLDHAWIFARNFLLIGIPVGLIGLAALWKSDRRLAIFYLMLLVINLGYFTFHYVGDYYTMVSPSYLVFSVLLGYGFAALWQSFPRWRVVTGGAVLLIWALLLGIQFRERREIALSHPVTDFVESSFDLFPPNAVVISQWDQFTPLVYFQATTGKRADCTFMERTPGRRYYGATVIDGHRSFLSEQISTRPIVIDSADRELREKYKVTPLGKHWFLVEPGTTGSPSRGKKESRRQL